MRILVTGDWHLDHWLQAGRDPLAMLPPEFWASLEALIITGDLAEKPKTRWPKMLARLGHHIDPARIHVLPGNHDYWQHRIDGDDRLAALCHAAGAQFAQQAEITLGDTRFLCCTLWTDLALHGDPAGAARILAREMNDYRHIRHAGAGYRRLRPEDTARIYAGHRAWLADRLAAPFPGRSIVITHHCPHPGLIGTAPAPTDPAYGSDLRALIAEGQPDVWFFGHTHHPAEAVLGRTRLRNVSLGYPDQVPPGTEAARLLRGLIEV